MTNSRAHMMRPLESVSVVEREQVVQPTVENVIGVQDIVWDSFYDMRTHFTEQFRMGALPSRETPVDTSKKTTVIAGKEVERMPVLDDFAEMMRKEDVDSHTRLERYVNPIGPNGGLDWFQSSLLGVMIENGRIGIKELGSGIRGVYINRSRAGNPFFRIWGGRLSVLIAVLQWCVLAGVDYYSADVLDFLGLNTGGYVVQSRTGAEVVVVLIFAFLFFFYNLVHWRFHKRYGFITNLSLVDGWKARYMHSPYDVKWIGGRMAAHAINVSLFATFIINVSLYAANNLGWL